MDWMEEAAMRQKRGCQLLLARDSECLQPLSCLLGHAPRRAVVLWALELGSGAVAALEQRYPEEPRPRAALEGATAWAAGRIKMPRARRLILDCHALARELTDPADIALCHAVGQACAVVHTPGHALGFPMYELTALIRRHGLTGSRDAVEKRLQVYADRLRFHLSGADDPTRDWAPFLRS